MDNWINYVHEHNDHFENGSKFGGQNKKISNLNYQNENCPKL